MFHIISIAIRDDDTGFFTKPEDLRFVYIELEDFPISFSVVPFVTDVCGGCSEALGNTSIRGVADNVELVSYLKELSNSRKGEILMHGITHQYKENDGELVPEFLWKDISELRKELPSAKK